MWFISATACLLALPLMGVLGSNAMWGLLPFALLAIGAIWMALQISYRSGQTREELELCRDRLLLIRSDPKRAPREWQTNPYWVRAALRDGPVEDYLTLSDGQREVELGIFLTPPERRALLRELQHRLAQLR